MTILSLRLFQLFKKYLEKTKNRDVQKNNSPLIPHSGHLLGAAREKAVASALIFAAEQCVRKAGASDARAAGDFLLRVSGLAIKVPIFCSPEGGI